MRFYSRIVRKPESIIKEVKDGLRVVSRTKICQFHNGVCDTEDPKVINELKQHPNRFRTDKPWPTNHWQDTAEGKRLLKRGEALGIDIRHIRKEYLIKLIKEIEVDRGIATAEPEPDVRMLDYPELLAKAKIMGISTHKKNKETLFKEIQKKELGKTEEKDVIINVR